MEPTGNMALFTIEEVAEVLAAKFLTMPQSPRLRKRIRRVWTDSRTVRAGDLFVALVGDRFDGHQYVAAALNQGAAGAVVRESYQLPSFKKSVGEPVVFGVKDTLHAYQQLATHHRNRFDIPLVAVTGSNGKTTTKEMVTSVLARRWKVLKTEGNLNNRIGVPQTLFHLTPRHQAAVIEMGVDQQGQTARLCEIARPTIGIITNIGPDHLEFFGSMEGSAQAKAELLDHMPADGIVVLNADDQFFDYLASRAGCRVLSFGFGNKADVRATRIRSDDRRGSRFDLVLPERARSTAVELRAHGTHNIGNALAAAAVGYALGLPASGIAQGLVAFRPVAMRSQVSMTHGVQLINDCYNANPASMKAAIALLVELGTGKRTIAAVGDMLELGPEAVAMHRDVGAFLAERGVTYLIACGPLGRELAEGARRSGLSPDRIVEAADAAAAGVALKALVRQGDVVLVKASRGMRMEQVVETLTGMRRVAKQAS